MENPNFLKQKYDLHNAPEVEAATKRAEIRSDEKIPQNPADRIQNYLDRFKEITDRENPDKREHGIDALKRLLHAKFVIKPEEIPEAYFDNQKRLAREQGHGDIEITDEMREQLTEVIITDQKSTLDNWIEYLSSPDATYPDWLKYYAIRSILGMGEFDKEKKQFTKRSAGTVKPFPDLNREALAYVLDSIEKKQAGIKTVSTIDLETNEEEYKKFEKILQGENFAKLYAWAIDKVTPASQEALAKTQGKWVKYDRNSDHMPLVESLQSHGTGWCTAGESTAHAQLQGGDFYVYYSFDEHGKPVIPRAAIRMQENGIAEVRGVASEQNIDPYIGDIVKQKLTEFPDGKAYEKKSADMKLLTEIDNKVKQKKPLTKEDIVFLYEINEKIEGFGYQRDPRIEEIRNQRNPQEDVVIVFECTKDQIAYDISEIKENTKAYIGPLVPGIFNVIREHNIEHIYTSFPFPEGRIYIESVEIGKKDAGELIREMREKNINVRNYAGDMMKDKDFTVLKESESIALIRLKVGDLGFSKYKHPTTNEIYKRIQELGLKLCPAEAGPHYRLKYINQPIYEWIRIGMKQICEQRVPESNDPCLLIFIVGRDEDGLYLHGVWANPDDDWESDDEFVFRI